MNNLNLLKVICILITGILHPGITAQEVNLQNRSIRKDAVKVYIDCRHCDMNYIREEIPYVNYVRDVREAELYILETRQSTGSGGSEYTFFFQGQKKYLGKLDTIVFHSSPDDSNDQVRVGRTNMIKMGLMSYVAKTPLYREVEITSNEDLREEEVIDNWNYWVFELQTEPQFDFEETLKEFSWENSFAAFKITPDWKLEFEFDQSFTRKRYIFEDTTYTRDKSYWSSDNLIVKSISDHWSVGIYYELGSSSYRNIQLNMSIFPAVEYNIFPYSESTHRQLRVLYGLGYSMNHYRDTTIYDKIQENLFEQKLGLAYRIQEKWGYINVSFQASNYLHDFSKNMIELNAYTNIRVFKGFSFRLRGGIARIHDQLGLVKGDLDEAEILLRLHELATEYRVEASLGIVYTFGSIYNNVVNPRFGN